MLKYYNSGNFDRVDFTGFIYILEKKKQARFYLTMYELTLIH